MTYRGPHGTGTLIGSGVQEVYALPPVLDVDTVRGTATSVRGKVCETFVAPDRFDGQASFFLAHPYRPGSVTMTHNGIPVEPGNFLEADPYTGLVTATVNDDPPDVFVICYIPAVQVCIPFDHPERGDGGWSITIAPYVSGSVRITFNGTATTQFSENNPATGSVGGTDEYDGEPDAFVLCYTPAS